MGFSTENRVKRNNKKKSLNSQVLEVRGLPLSIKTSSFTLTAHFLVPDSVRLVCSLHICVRQEKGLRFSESILLPPRKIFNSPFFQVSPHFPAELLLFVSLSLFTFCVCYRTATPPKASGLTYFLAAQQSVSIKAAFKESGRCQTKWNSSVVIYVRVQKCTFSSDGLFLSLVWFQDRPEAAPNALIAKIAPLFSSDL